MSVLQVFGPKVAVHDLSVDLVEGQMLALLGHNGAGDLTTSLLLTQCFAVACMYEAAAAAASCSLSIDDLLGPATKQAKATHWSITLSQAMHATICH